MAEGTQSGQSFEDVERFALSNYIFFRQWERHSASGRRVPLVAIAAMALLVLASALGIWILSERLDWALAAFAIGSVLLGYLAIYRRTLRFNSLIIAKEFVVWETQCREPWKFLHRSFPFRHLDLPFKLKGSQVVVPVNEITNWSTMEEEQTDGTATPTKRIVLWRGTSALRTFLVASRDSAISLEDAIRTAIGSMNQEGVSGM